MPTNEPTTDYSPYYFRLAMENLNRSGNTVDPALALVLREKAAVYAALAQADATERLVRATNEQSNVLRGYPVTR